MNFGIYSFEILEDPCDCCLHRFHVIFTVWRVDKLSPALSLNLLGWCATPYLISATSSATTH